ncbi:MAG: response regulator [Desulfobacula sp.]|nr:response regulator [Desulfobacula sp.]
MEKIKKLHSALLKRMIPQGTHDISSLAYWRAQILFSVIFSGVLIGTFVLIIAIPMFIEEKLWKLLFFDSSMWVVGMFLLIFPRINYTTRAAMSVLSVYTVGLFIIIFVGPMSGGPAWLFCFPILAAILLGSWAAVAAVLTNAVTIIIFCYLMINNIWGQSFPFFNSSKFMYVAGINFLYLNALAAISVSVLIKGLIQSHEKENRLLRSLKIEIQERQKAQEEKLETQKILEEQKRLSMIGQVAGKMAHDFNNVLGIIMGNTELLLMDYKDTKIRKTLELIFGQTKRGKNLTKNLVIFAKSQEPRYEFFKISDKIDFAVNLIQNDLERIELIRENKSDIPSLFADSEMIEHSLINLLQNSIHALSLVEHPKIVVRTYCTKENICFEIEDNGCGIPKEYIKKIYDPSFTLKGSMDALGLYKTGIKGTGYGMANIKKYIDLHNGSIDCESQLSSGTKFTIRLPIIQKELSTKEKIEIQELEFQKNKYILLVEDEPSISDVQYNVLTHEPCNHKVDIANNGQLAMDMFDNNKYDILSLDYILPGSINGMDVYHHIRKAKKTIPILFISGNIEFLESIKDLKLHDENIDHLSKPCQNKDYLNSINRLLNGKTPLEQKIFITL